MSINNNSKAVTDGLVLYYDANNAKSYAGPPLQNILTQITPTGMGVSAGYAVATGSETVNIPTLGDTFVNYVTIQNNYPSVSGNCCPRLYQYGSGTLLPSTLYTYAIVYKCESGYTGPNFMYQYDYNGGAYVTEFGLHTTGQRIHLGGSWYWAWATFTTQASVNTLQSSGLWYYQYSTGVDKVTVAKAMMVQGDYTGLHPRYWPALGTTRANTAVISDLTGNNAITATSLTYATNGTFSFNGNSNYIQGTSSCGITGSVTLSAIIKPSYSGQTGPHSTILCTDVNYPHGAKLMNYKNSARYGLWLGFGGTDNYEAFVGTDINDNTIKMLTASWDQSTGIVNIYLNGILQSSISTAKTIPTVLANGLITLGTDYHSIGAAAKNKFLGNIYCASIYNRALSAAEVYQNFNAIRSRYGL